MEEPDYYSVLGIACDASAEEVRQAFRRAALLLHPDKAPARAAPAAGPSPATSEAGRGATPQPGSASLTQRHAGSTPAPPPPADAAAAYLHVQQAWAVLGDAAARAAYDRRLALRALRQDVHINESVDLREMDAHGDLGRGGQLGFTWPCRCGGEFGLLAEDAASGVEVLVPCSTCSLYLRVHTASTE